MAIHQISVFLENRAGQLAEITALLAKNGIDLRAINIAETSDYGVLRQPRTGSLPRAARKRFYLLLKRCYCSRRIG